MEKPPLAPVLTLCDDLSVSLADYARTGLRFGIWASSGRGKSFGVGVLCEELLAAGIPVIALDPEGEIFTLRERFRVLVLGGAHADLPLPTGDAAVALALRKALDEGLGLVLDL
ncbi:MAG: helicase HerA domain-containing protein, partial [Byssovorax sp.]